MSAPKKLKRTCFSRTRGVVYTERASGPHVATASAIAIDAPIAEMRKARRGAWRPRRKIRTYPYATGPVTTAEIARFVIIWSEKRNETIRPVRNARTTAPYVSPAPRNGRYAVRSRTTAPAPETTMAAIVLQRRIATRTNPLR